MTPEDDCGDRYASHTNTLTTQIDDGQTTKQNHRTGARMYAAETINDNQHRKTQSATRCDYLAEDHQDQTTPPRNLPKPKRKQPPTGVWGYFRRLANNEHPQPSPSLVFSSARVWLHTNTKHTHTPPKNLRAYCRALAAGLS